MVLICNRISTSSQMLLICDNLCKLVREVFPDAFPLIATWLRTAPSLLRSLTLRSATRSVSHAAPRRGLTTRSDTTTSPSSKWCANRAISLTPVRNSPRLRGRLTPHLAYGARSLVTGSLGYFVHHLPSHMYIVRVAIEAKKNVLDC